MRASSGPEELQVEQEGDLKSELLSSWVTNSSEFV